MIRKRLRNTKLKILKDFLTLLRLNRKKEQVYKLDIASFSLSETMTSKRFGSDYTYYPLMDDKTSHTEIEPHYTYHPAWAARILAATRPEKHIDISSIYYFSTLVSAFIPIEFYDYRPANIHLHGLSTNYADLTKLHFPDNSIQSLSCMHTIEHIGLGRYGDEIDYDGDLKAIGELSRVLAINGDLLVVVPIGIPKIAFNAHRIYSYDQIISYFSDLALKEFSLVPDQFEEIGIIKNASKDLADKQHWGCGCFWFKKSKK